MPQLEVGRTTGGIRIVVTTIFAAFRDDNGHIHDAPHDVRPRSTTEEEDRSIVAAAVDEPFMTASHIRGEPHLNKRVLGAMLCARSQFELRDTKISACGLLRSTDHGRLKTGKPLFSATSPLSQLTGTKDGKFGEREGHARGKEWVTNR
ncbi:hypothetical protein HPB47_007052 [Ixodes persulcatus]|uniref:Uncharacterized protein n=1 Tax=Ixodes persulcatus TaxID=34615 RepID=A0AC60P9H4_IXOPE|nr:hypothetical protein HPB47_007052 [Ixodes persulcatus]